MDLTRVIKGSIVTEKAEQLKLARTYTLKIDKQATKVDVKNALQKFFGVNVASVRVHRLVGKKRMVAQNKTFTKRQPAKRAIVTLTQKSKPLDISTFSAS